MRHAVVDRPAYMPESNFLHYPLKMLVGRVEYFARPSLRSAVVRRIGNALTGRVSGYEMRRIALAAFIYRRMAMADEELSAREIAGRLKLAEEPSLPAASHAVLIAPASIFHSSLKDVLEARLRPGQSVRLHLIPAPQVAYNAAQAGVEAARDEAEANGAPLGFSRYIRQGASQARLYCKQFDETDPVASLAVLMTLLDASMAENPAQYDWFADPPVSRVLDLAAPPPSEGRI